MPRQSAGRTWQRCARRGPHSTQCARLRWRWRCRGPLSSRSDPPIWSGDVDPGPPKDARTEVHSSRCPRCLQSWPRRTTRPKDPVKRQQTADRVNGEVKRILRALAVWRERSQSIIRLGSLRQDEPAVVWVRLSRLDHRLLVLPEASPEIGAPTMDAESCLATRKRDDIRSVMCPRALSSTEQEVGWRRTSRSAAQLGRRQEGGRTSVKHVFKYAFPTILLSGCGVKIGYWEYDPSIDCVVSHAERRPAEHWPDAPDCTMTLALVPYSNSEGNCILIKGYCGTDDPWLHPCDESSQPWCCSGSVPRDSCWMDPDG